MAMKNTLVLYPSPGMGHLVCMVELGKLILNHNPSLSITILITPPPYNTGSTAPYIKRVSQTTPSINFHNLPPISLPDLDFSSHEALTFELIRLNNPLVHEALQTISQTCTVNALIIDFFCTLALEVSNDLDIRTFYLYTTSIASLAVLLSFPAIRENVAKSSNYDSNMQVHIPGIPSILASDMPNPIFGPADKATQGFLNTSLHMPKSHGIIINSFASLEPRALKAMSDGLCVPNAPTPPLYCIGPVIADPDRNGGSGVHECLSWLDSQPTRRVVYLCFGSLGLFSEAQLKAIAAGLENSGQRFLWVVRSPPTKDKSKRYLAPPEPDLNVLLPEGFLDRTKDKGLVVKSWAPQVAVLSHESVGGFVTHCGWNSVLESVCAALPMIAWPLYAEQKLNKVFLVEELKLALPMEKSGDGFVTADEVEKRVRQLMESEEGKVVREQAEKMSQEAKATMNEGGSSLEALNKLVELLM